MTNFLICLSLIFLSSLANAKPKIQNEDIRGLTDITAAVLTTTGNIANGSACISSIGSTAGLAIGLFVYDTTTPSNIASGITIAGLPGTCSAGQVQMSANSTHTATGEGITFGGQKSQLINDSKMYVTGASLNDQFSTLLSNNNIINSSSTTAATIPAALTCSSTLNVTGTTALGNLNVTGPAVLSNTLNVTGNTALSGGVGIPSQVAIGFTTPFADTALFVDAPASQMGASATSQWAIVGALNANSAATTKAVAGAFSISTAASSTVGQGYGLFLDTVNIGAGGTMGHYAGLSLAGDSPAGSLQSYAVFTAGTAKSSFGGNVGIGTTTPSAALEVNGGATIDGQLIGGGTTVSSNASAGQIGEYLQSVTLRSSPVTVTSGVYVSVATIPLTAGDWEVNGFVGFTGSSATITSLSAQISTSPTTPVAPTNTYGASITQDVSSIHIGANAAAINLSNDDYVTTMPNYRALLNGNQTIYLLINNTFATGTANAYGRLTAIRAR